jgi:uncharacterized membrane protein YebE (DUF533 family)
MKGRVIMNNKLEELLNAAKLGELLHKKEAEKDKTSHTILIVLAVIGAVAAVAAIAYAVYRYFTPDYLEDFEDDFDDDFDDDFVDNDNETNAASANSTASAEKTTI